jgi:hypothetical protein
LRLWRIGFGAAKILTYFRLEFASYEFLDVKKALFLIAANKRNRVPRHCGPARSAYPMNVIFGTSLIKPISGISSA